MFGRCLARLDRDAHSAAAAARHTLARGNLQTLADPLLAVLGEEARSIDEIALRLGQPLARTLAVLARAEAEGIVRRTEDGRYVRAR